MAGSDHGQEGFSPTVTFLPKAASLDNSNETNGFELTPIVASHSSAAAGEECQLCPAQGYGLSFNSSPSMGNEAIWSDPEQSATGGRLIGCSCMACLFVGVPHD